MIQELGSRYSPAEIYRGTRLTESIMCPNGVVCRHIANPSQKLAGRVSPPADKLEDRVPCRLL